ncbi:hypothetical protein M0811_04529 [Anaeramoeba ignava]|uniref:Uncharacterized protein n=1 Tax=Anaeramoeba ignava TaxID=1746090 RepID=A0A9Q0RFE8_ANAIG|nr:hypothetical protein M0811_04529 [Anaeramoeba ignava]
MGNSPNALQIPKSKANNYLKRITTNSDPICLLSPTKEMIRANKVFMDLFRGSKKQVRKMQIVNQLPRLQTHFNNQSSVSIIEREVSNAIADINGRCSFFIQMKRFTGEIFWAHVGLLMVNVNTKPMCQVLIKETEKPQTIQVENIEEVETKLVVDLTDDPSDAQTAEFRMTGGTDSETSGPNLHSVGFTKTQFSSPSNSRNFDDLPPIAQETSLHLEPSPIDTQISELIHSTKSQIRACENMDLEHLIVPKLNAIERIFSDVNQRLAIDILQLKSNIQHKRIASKKKYDSLESDIQRRLEGMKEEQIIKKKIESENHSLKKEFRLYLNSIHQLQEISDKTIQLISQEQKDF